MTGSLKHVIGRPHQAHGARSPEDYRAQALATLRRRAARFGGPDQLTERSERPVAYVSDSRWVCDCDCRNGCSADPDWGLAICFACGAVYRPVFPDDVAEVERELLLRPDWANRHFFPDPVAAARMGMARPEGFDDLRTENIAHGLRRS